MKPRTVFPGRFTAQIGFLVPWAAFHCSASSRTVRISGPPMSATLPAGAPPASSTSRCATSSVAIGCAENGSASSTGSLSSNSAAMKVWNCVARRIVNGTPDSSMARSLSTLSR